MSKRKRKKNGVSAERKIIFPGKIKRWIAGILMVLASIIIALSFFNKAGIAGESFFEGGIFLVGLTFYVTPIIFLLGGFVFIFSNYPVEIKKERSLFYPIIIAIIILVLGITGLLGVIDNEVKQGGIIGYILSWPLLKYFGVLASSIIFIAFISIGLIIFKHFLNIPSPYKKEETLKEEEEKKPSVFRRILNPNFKVKEIEGVIPKDKKEELKEELPKIEPKPIALGKIFPYKRPPLDILESEKEVPAGGDIKVNSAIIKKTLQNFGIDVTMSEVNTGPTVTQYTFKPAEGVKLSKITGLNNDLSLALASHPLRIEAPIPGRSLVGIEVPNKSRAQVRLRNLIENPTFDSLPMNLTLALGKDVAGFPVYVDIVKMPHLLVAGSTGSGKTIFLNSLITNLLYQPSTTKKSASPKNLRFIMVDPKRVEFPVYSNLPHLLCPVIYNAVQTVNALRWLTGEMERRFDVLSSAKVRDIGSFNEKSLKSGEDVLPFIVVIIDELADLMAAKGREIEAAIVRLAQMARAVGIHLVVATQRPSVEVITGLIKANITSRITFQVASQVDSRTIIDTSGAEKLLGAGDMLYISSEFGKPKRIQGAYVSEKEIRKAVSYIVEKEQKETKEKTEMEENLLKEIEKTTEEEEGGMNFSEGGEEDPLYEEAKKIVIESNKASASLLQRRIKIGYARAARIIDMLEERGVVGPADGARPREIYVQREDEFSDDKENWKKI